ncbi:MAG: LptF/LptG family permease [Rikenellaceae bacterium]
MERKFNCHFRKKVIKNPFSKKNIKHLFRKRVIKKPFTWKDVKMLFTKEGLKNLFKKNEARRNAIKVGLIDRYIIGKFLGTYVATILMLVVIVVIFDMVEKIDDLMELHAPLKDIIFRYYINFVPFFINKFSGLITFISVILFTSKMAYQTEIIAILSSGVSFKRMMWPYFISALIITTLSLGLNLFVIPMANAKRIDFEAEYSKKGKRGYFEERVYRQIAPGSFASIKGYDSKALTAEFLVLETYDKGRIVSTLSASDATYNPSTHHWQASKYLKRTYQGDVENLTKAENLDTLINLTSEEIGKIQNYIQTLRIDKLNRFIAQQKAKGSDQVALIEVERQNRLAYPISTFILTLIGVSLSSRKVRGGTGLHISIGITLCFSYILFMQFANEFAKGGAIDPIIAVWIPNILFAFIAAYVYKKAPK